jgi:hypothetical protein
MLLILLFGPLGTKVFVCFGLSPFPRLWARPLWRANIRYQMGLTLTRYIIIDIDIIIINSS